MNGHGGPPIKDITVVTFHFGSIFWVQNLAARLIQFPDPRIKQFLIVDQSRRDVSHLSALSGVTRVVTYPVNASEIETLGHDHPSAIHHVMEEDLQTSHIMLMDSDCFPVRPGWSRNLAPIHLAGDPNGGGLTHPCFNLLPLDVFRRLDYRLGMDGAGFDTGRLIGFQVHRMGLEGSVDKPRRSAFGGRRGSFYRDDNLYHHGSASFVASDEQRLTKQVNEFEEDVLQNCVSEGRFTLSLRERIALSAHSRFGWKIR